MPGTVNTYTHSYNSCFSKSITWRFHQQQQQTVVFDEISTWYLQVLYPPVIHDMAPQGSFYKENRHLPRLRIVIFPLGLYIYICICIYIYTYSMHIYIYTHCIFVDKSISLFFWWLNPSWNWLALNLLLTFLLPSWTPNPRNPSDILGGRSLFRTSSSSWTTAGKHGLLPATAARWLVPTPDLSMNNSWVSWWIWVKTVKTIKHRDSIKSGDTIPSIIIYKNHKKRQVLCQLCSVCNLRWNVITTKALVAAETINGGQSWLLQPISWPFYHNWKVANISLL